MSSSGALGEATERTLRTSWLVAEEKVESERSEWRAPAKIIKRFLMKISHCSNGLERSKLKTFYWIRSSLINTRSTIACRSPADRSKFARRFVCRSLENRSICEIRQDRALSGRGPFEYGQFIQMISLVLTCLFLNLVSLIWLPEPLRIALVCRSCLNGREVFV